MKKILLYFFVFIQVTISSCTSLNSPSAKDLEVKRITDSLRVADSLAMAMYSPQKSGAISQKGIWITKFYVDDFGDPTKEKHITTSPDIFGFFSNSATENADLKVRFLIDNPESVAIMLFEYAGKNPVKSSIEYGYRIKVKSKDSEIIVLNAKNDSDRLILNKKDSKKLCDILSKGGRVEFSIIELSEYSTSSYKFAIDNADGFDEILQELIK